jgi:hypothetical protein
MEYPDEYSLEGVVDKIMDLLHHRMGVPEALAHFGKKIV